MSKNDCIFLSIIVKNYFRILEVITSFNIVLNTGIRAGRRFKISDLEIVAFSLTSEPMHRKTLRFMVIICTEFVVFQEFFSQ